jgi:hypothetical protein
MGDGSMHIPTGHFILVNRTCTHEIFPLRRKLGRLTVGMEGHLISGRYQPASSCNCLRYLHRHGIDIRIDQKLVRSACNLESDTMVPTPSSVRCRILGTL